VSLPAPAFNALVRFLSLRSTSISAFARKRSLNLPPNTQKLQATPNLETILFLKMPRINPVLRNQTMYL